MPDQASIPITKEALLGRRAYDKALDSVFQESLADSAMAHQREAMAKVAQAWSHLDEVDPHGEFMLLKAMVDRLQGDSRLASALGVSISPVPTPRRESAKPSETMLSGSTAHGTSTTRIRSGTTSTATGTTSIRNPPELSTSPANTPNQTPFSTPTGTTSTSPLKGPKLVLANNNPHLKSHRRRQSAFVVGDKGVWGNEKLGDMDERKLPGHVEKGMEQQGLLQDILYGQWIAGLKSRWPLV
jgi:serine/threonine-protein kinase 24/25/MST4